MKVEVRVPQWGMGISEATVVGWLKEIGDDVTEDEPLVEIETAKASDVVNAPASGVLVDIYAQSGSVVPVSELIGIIEA